MMSRWEFVDVSLHENLSHGLNVCPGFIVYRLGSKFDVRWLQVVNILSLITMEYYGE